MNIQKYMQEEEKIKNVKRELIKYSEVVTTVAVLIIKMR